MREYEEAKREEDWKRLANIETNLALNTSATKRIENTLDELNRKLDKYPVICEKVDQHDRWLIGGFIGIICLAVQAGIEWITRK